MLRGRLFAGKVKTRTLENHKGAAPQWARSLRFYCGRSSDLLSSHPAGSKWFYSVGDSHGYILRVLLSPDRIMAREARFIRWRVSRIRNVSAVSGET